MPFLHLLHLFVFLMTRYMHSCRVASKLRDGAWMPCSRIRAGWAMRARHTGHTGRERVLIWGHVRDGGGLVHAGRIGRVLSRWAWWDGHGWICRVWRWRKGRIGLLKRRSCVSQHGRYEMIKGCVSIDSRYIMNFPWNSRRMSLWRFVRTMIMDDFKWYAQKDTKSIITVVNVSLHCIALAFKNHHPLSLHAELTFYLH